MVKNKLKELRESMGISQRQLSDATNINHVTISRLETGITSFNEQYIQILSNFFGVTSDYLLGIDEKVAFYKDENNTLTTDQVDAIRNLIDFYKNKNKKC